MTATPDFSLWLLHLSATFQNVMEDTLIFIDRDYIISVEMAEFKRYFLSMFASVNIL